MGKPPLAIRPEQINAEPAMDFHKLAKVFSNNHFNNQYMKRCRIPVETTLQDFKQIGKSG